MDASGVAVEELQAEIDGIAEQVRQGLGGDQGFLRWMRRLARRIMPFT